MIVQTVRNKQNGYVAHYFMNFSERELDLIRSRRKEHVQTID